ncbi:unnamed protein product, partial [Ectocarpus sp. 8 AP-2014]
DEGRDIFRQRGRVGDSSTMIKRATTVLVLSLVCCSGLAPPIRPKRTTTPTQGWTARKNWKSVLRASTPPHGDSDYGYDSNDGVDQRALQRQGEEVDVISVSGNGQAAGAAATAAPGPVAAVTKRPAFGTAAEGGDPTHDIRG